MGRLGLGALYMFMHIDYYCICNYMPMSTIVAVILYDYVMDMAVT